MLLSLSISNYVLIRQLEIRFHDGFSVITGETGAGKSIILGAVSLLLGQRADTKMIYEGEKRCIVEAEFDVAHFNISDLLERFDVESEGPTCIIRRELSATGKSRAFINDTPVSLTALRELGERLIDIHSQHKNLLLATEDFQVQVLDTLAADADILNSYAATFKAYNLACRQLDEARQAVAQAQADEDYLRFQLQQLDELNPAPGRQAELEQEQQLLENAGDIKTALWTTASALQGDGAAQGGALTALREAGRQLQTIARLLPAADELSQRIDSTLIELRDIAATVESEAERINDDPARLEAVSEWLSTLYSAMRKHHVETEDELLQLHTDLRKRLDKIENSDEHINILTRERDRTAEALKTAAAKLTEVRTKAAAVVERRMHEMLVPLGIPNVEFRVDIRPRKEPAGNGMDEVAFMFSANQGSALRPIAEVASGGEIARVMLSLKAIMSGAAGLPTIIFDEIDTGVSGKMAERMAEMMRDMAADGRQVISITHLPQIAALGQHHYRVYKHDDGNATTSNIEELSTDARISEIAAMLSGAETTQAALDNARALLKGIRD